MIQRPFASARARFWEILRAFRRREFRRKLASRDLRPRRGHPALSYGDLPGLAGTGVVHGGKVKLLHLASEFPAAEDFNLLYLVSSAAPEFALEFVIWAKARGVKLVWNQNGVAYRAWSGERSEEINGPMRALRQHADFIFYQSEFCRQCADRFLGSVGTLSEIAFNSVDLAEFRPATVPARDVCRLLAAGSHYESYRVFSALETVAELVRRDFPVELHLAGRLAWNHAETEVAARIAALGIAKHVRRTAAYRQADAPALYQAAHILLHPKYKDPCPTVPIEALACGVPVIGSRSGGMPELVAPDAGVLIEVEESWTENHWPAPGAMADAVEAIMQDWLRHHFAARAHAEAQFSKEHWLSKHRRIFATLAPT